MREYAASIVWFSAGLIIIIWQFVFPDPMPELIIKQLERDNSSFVGLDFVMEAFLLLYIISGFVSFIIGIVTMFFTYRRSH